MKRLLGYNAAYTLKCAMEKLKKVICSHNFLLSHEKNYFHLFMTIFLTHSWGKQCVSKRKTWNHSLARDSKPFFFQHNVFPTPDPENQSFTGENVFLIEKTENYVNKVPLQNAMILSCETYFSIKSLILFPKIFKSLLFSIFQNC